MDTALCAKCGACSTVCPVYRVTGLESDTARGKVHLLTKLADSPHSAAYREIFSRCLLCGACRNACPRDLNLPDLVAEARSDFPRLTGSGSFSKLLATSCLAHPAILAGFAEVLRISGPLLRKIPPESGLRLKLGLFLDQPPKAPGSEKTPPPQAAMNSITTPDGIAIFPGCLAQHLLPGIGMATVKLLGEGNQRISIPRGQTCCGLATFSAGNPSEARRLARRNLDAFAAGTGPIVTPCGSCYSHLLSYPELLRDDRKYLPRAQSFAARLRELSAFLSSKPKPQSGKNKPERVFYHDPCHLRFHPGLCEAPRRLLRAFPDIELVGLPDGPRCCGLGGTFNLAHPELSRKIGADLVGDIALLTPDLVLTSCSGCLIQLQREFSAMRAKIPVQHLAEFLASR